MELSKTRRRTMQAVRSSDTGPEMIVRRMLQKQVIDTDCTLSLFRAVQILCFRQEERLYLSTGVFGTGIRVCVGRACRKPTGNIGRRRSQGIGKETCGALRSYLRSDGKSALYGNAKSNRSIWGY